jgi:hypothetical protein
LATHQVYLGYAESFQSCVCYTLAQSLWGTRRCRRDEEEISCKPSLAHFPVLLL